MHYSTTQSNAKLGSSDAMTSIVINGANSIPRDASELSTRRPHPPRPCHASTPSSPAHSTAPIRLPKTHIHRTPSELQLAQELLKADYCERKMYARLVYGMSHHCEQKESEMHPLTVKSIHGVLNAHHQGSLDRRRHLADAETGDWEVCYQDDAEVTNTRSSIVSSDDGDEDDECVFDLEM